MPAATTHIEFAKDVYHALPIEEKKQITNLNLFYLGAQGPDLFFFSHAGIPPLSLSKYGHQMHNEKIEEVINFFLYYAYGTPLMDYVKGYLCHYAMDSLCHPIIRHYARIWATNKDMHEGEAHVTIEAYLDVYVLDQKNKTIDDYNVHNDLSISKKDCKMLANIYHDMFLNVFGYNIPRSKLIKVPIHIARYTRMMRPNSLKKYNYVYKIESKLNQPHAVTGMLLNNKSIDDLDVLNNDHMPYCIPDTNEFQDNRSFNELYKDSLEYALDLLMDPINQTYVRNFVGDRIENVKSDY